MEARERKAQGLGPHDMVSTHTTILDDDAFLELLDAPKTFPLLWDILGWNIQLYMSTVLIYPPEQLDPGKVRGKSAPPNGTRTAVARCARWSTPTRGCR